MIGANGSGKTSLLDAMNLLSGSAQAGLTPAINEMGGLVGIKTRDRSGALDLGISMKMPEFTFDYLLSLRLRGYAHVIDRETLGSQHEAVLLIDARPDNIRYHHIATNFVPQAQHYNPLESALSQVPKTFADTDAFRRQLASINHYHQLNVAVRSPVRLPQPMRPATLPGVDGENLVSCLYSLRESRPDRFETLSDTLSAAFPGFQRLEFPPVAAGTLGMGWREKAFTEPFYTHQLSEGTLRFLWLAALLYSPEPAALTLIDEPEVSLHPELLSLLVGVMREASHDSQIVVATHSDRLIRFLRPDEVLVVDSAEDGTSTLTWADEMDLDKWLAEYALDELWRAGRLGGRP
jgi:predicted ATPase